MTHHCERDLPKWGDARAVDSCQEIEGGYFLVTGDNYGSIVPYCPFCGAKAPRQPLDLNADGNLPPWEIDRIQREDHDRRNLRFDQYSVQERERFYLASLSPARRRQREISLEMARLQAILDARRGGAGGVED